MEMEGGQRSNETLKSLQYKTDEMFRGLSANV